jgi:hypothetical protein
LETQQDLIPRKTFLAGVIYFDQRKQTVNCIVRELSAKSSTLVCQDATAIPTNIIELYIPSQNEFLPAEIKERAGTELRIAFRPIHDTAPTEGGSPEIFRRLRLLEAEVGQLRRIVDELRDARARQGDLAI